MSSQASEKSSSLPSPMCQGTKAHLAHFRSKSWSRRAQAAATAVLLCTFTAHCTLAGLIINASFAAGGAAKPDGILVLDGGDGNTDIFGNHFARVEQAPGRVFTMARAQLHLVGWLNTHTRDLRYSKLFIGGFSAEMTGAHVTRGKRTQG